MYKVSKSGNQKSDIFKNRLKYLHTKKKVPETVK